MRIISGQLGGRIFNSPPGHRTHPMSEKIKGALFNILGNINGLSVLDSFAGSGSLSFEAISRGASRVVAVESDINAYKTIVKNMEQLKIENSSMRAIRANINSWLDQNDESFNLVFCDPPYNKVRNDLLNKIAMRTKTNAVVVFSLPPNSDFILDTPFTLIKSKQYGDASLVIYRNNG